MAVLPPLPPPTANCARSSAHEGCRSGRSAGELKAAVLVDAAGERDDARRDDVVHYLVLEAVLRRERRTGSVEDHDVFPPDSSFLERLPISATCGLTCQQILIRPKRNGGRRRCRRSTNPYETPGHQRVSPPNAFMIFSPSRKNTATKDGPDRL